MTTYSTKSNANRAATKALGAGNFNIVPDGNKFGFVSNVKPNNRRGGWKFGEGYSASHPIKGNNPESLAAIVYAMCAELADVLGVPVPPRAIVLHWCAQLGIKATSASAGYTHWKHKYNLNHKAGRATNEQWEIYNTAELAV